MRSSTLSSTALGTLCLAVLSAAVADAATITGTVTGPDGAPFRAAFVQARNAATKITVSVLSDSQGHYQVPDLSPGDYRLSIRAPGYKSDPKSGIKLAADQNAAQDFALQKGLVRWSDISYVQGQKLLPDAPGKELFFTHCTACHGFESRMAAVKRDADGWRDRVAYMREAMGFFINRPQLQFTDEKADTIASYLNDVFGEDSKLPSSPADLPQYQETLHKFSDEALKIVYVLYEMPPGRMTWDANPDKDGNVWCPYFGTVNGVGRLNPETGELTEYLWESQSPRVGTRSVQMTHDGVSAWVVEEGGTLVKVDVKTGKQTKYKGPGKTMNTVREDPNGILWVSGTPFSYRFDPKTGVYTEIKDAPATYGANLDRAGNIWFDEAGGAGRIFKVDYKTSKVTTWTPPPQPGSRRRFQLDANGVGWLAQYDRGQIVRLDTETGAFKEIQLPGEQPTPYPVGIDTKGQVWYASGIMDTVGRIDPATGKITEYPAPMVGNGMRELNNDPKGRMWFASPGNNTVGYMYLAK
jgi:virginiamycin B lyase